MEKTAGRRDYRAYFRENWWKYALLIALAVFAWNLIFAMTAPTIPEEEKLDVYFCAGYVDVYSLDEMAKAAQEIFPELQEVSLEGIPVDVARETDYVYQMQLVLRIGEQQGDLYIVSKERFEADIAPENGHMPLDDIAAFADLPRYEREGAFAAVDIGGWDLMEALEFDTSGCVAFLPYYCSNPEESGAFLQWLRAAAGERP